MRRRLRAALGTLLFVLVITTLALGRETPVVLLVVEGGGGAVVPRLAAELDALGFSVVRVAKTSRPLAEVAKSRRAQAAISVPRSRRALAVWVTDPEHRRAATRETEIAGEGVEDDVLVIRSVELLRAAFLEIDVAMPPPRAAPPPAASSSPTPAIASSSAPIAEPPSPPPPVVSASAAPSSAPVAPPAPSRPRPRRALSVAGGLSASPGGLPIEGHLFVDAARSLADSLWVGLFLSTPGLGATLTTGEGNARVWGSYSGVEVFHDVSLAPMRALFGAGAGAVWLHASGDPSVPDVTGQTQNVFVPWIFARAGAGLALGERTTLLLDARVGATTSTIRLRSAGNEIARAGRPLALPALGIEVRLD